jgi:hypothetical protein
LVEYKILNFLIVCYFTLSYSRNLTKLEEVHFDKILITLEKLGLGENFEVTFSRAS